MREGESAGEGERKKIEYLLYLWDLDDYIREIETPRPEYPGVTILPPKRNLVPRFGVRTLN